MSRLALQWNLTDENFPETINQLKIHKVLYYKLMV